MAPLHIFDSMLRQLLLSYHSICSLICFLLNSSCSWSRRWWWKTCSRHGDGSRRNSPLGDTMIELNKVIGDSFQVIVDGSTGSGNYYQAWPFLIDSRDLQRRGYARTNLVWASGSWNYCQMENSPKRPRPQSIRLATE